LQALTHRGIKGIKYNLSKKQVIYAFTKVFILYYHGKIGYDKLVRNENNQVIIVIVPYTKKSSVAHRDGSIVYTIESNPESSSTFFKAFTLTVGLDGYATFRSFISELSSRERLFRADGKGYAMHGEQYEDSEEEDAKRDV